MARLRKVIRYEGMLAYVPLSSGLECVIDAIDVPLISRHNWQAAKVGRHGHIYAVTYCKRNGKDSTMRMHRLLTDAPDGAQVDHADMNTLNNRRSNLRVCTKTQNLANKRVRQDSASGVKGVFLHPNGRYRAKIKFGGRQIHIGYFTTKADASRAYAERARQLFGEFARSK